MTQAAAPGAARDPGGRGRTGEIHVRGLRKVYRQKGTGVQVVAIDRLDFTVRQGEVVAIVGRTGCGKSTFLHILIGLEWPSAGAVEIDGLTPYGDFAAFRGRIAAVFQQDRLLPWRTVLHNVELGLEILGVEPGRRREVAEAWLDRLGLGQFLGAFPGELSGGMRQRVALARAFAVNPEILVADEAFGHLDEVTSAQIRQDFLSLARAEGKTVFLVTHQIEEALAVGERVLVFGRPATVLADVRPDALAGGDRAAARERIQGMLNLGRAPGGSEGGLSG
ncbi:MAG: ATP-binding cassette domain-containing protein [Armatimonadota bacterium]|nr:ATP-binding cassette domain-containing protein [Armatimonadota bacterium]MDR7535980.1 ATP-binding cassette domain-containing protein [Armatimonadota bacterium]